MEVPRQGTHHPRMTRRGYTIAELLVVLALLALLLAMAGPQAVRWRDAFAVRAARDDLAAALAWTRVAAVSGAGARLVVEPDPARFRTLTTLGDLGPAADLGDRYGVEFETPAAPTEIAYDALGIGRLASRTLILRRGAARAGVVISAYGRVRPW